MLRLVKAELFKLFKNKTFRVLCVVSILLSVLMFILSTPFMENVMMDSLGDLSEAEKQQALQAMGAREDDEQLVRPGSMGVQLTAKDPMNPTAIEVYHSSFGAGLSEILIGILIAAFLAKEYTEGTIKNTLAYGKKRSEFYIAKFLALIIGIATILASLTLVSTVGSTIINGWGEAFELSQLVNIAGTFIAAVIANASVAAILMIVAITVKSNGATIGITAGIFILAPMLLSFIYGIYPIFDKIYELTPFYNTALATSVYATSGDQMRSIMIALATIAICLLLGTKIFKAQDIK